MDSCLPGCRFCRLISTTCNLGLFVEGRFGVGSGWRSGEGKGVGSCGANTRGGGGGGEDGKDRVRCRDLSLLLGEVPSLDSCVWSGH